jgi:hypothetical protein
MKKSFLLSTLLALASSAFAQAPEKLSYQAVIRDIGGTLLTQEVIGMQLSILQGSETGPAVYVERQTPTSNENGLVSLEIGAGEFISGNFSEIDWADGPYYLKREIDPTGGFIYTITGIAELLSVPYALYSKRTQVHADGAYNLNYDLPSDNNTGTGNLETLLSTSINWLGDRVIMVSGTIHLEFHIPQVAIDNGIGGGTADVEMYLRYGNQVISVVNFEGVQIEDEAQVTLPISALIPNSVAGTSMQFRVEGGNSSQTFSIATIEPGGSGQTYGPYPIDVSVSTVLHVVEL